MKSGIEMNNANHSLCELTDDDLCQVTGGAVPGSDKKSSWTEEDRIILSFNEGDSQPVTLKREEDTCEFVHQIAEDITGNPVNSQTYPPTYAFP